MLYLLTAEVFGAVYTCRAAVLGDVGVTAAIVLGHVVLIATVVLGGDRVALKHWVELGSTLQCWYTVTTSSEKMKTLSVKLLKYS